MSASFLGLSEVVLSVREVQRAVAFYRDVLGLRVISPPELKGPVYLQVGEPDGRVHHQIVLAPLPPDAPDFPAERTHKQLRHFAIEVAPGSLDAERERLQALGLQVRTGEHPFLPLRAIYIDDPDGNEIELVTRKG